MKLGKQLKKIRKQNGLTQEELAERIYSSYQSVSNWERDKSSPNIETLIIIAKEFNISIDDLLALDKSNSQYDDIIIEAFLKILKDDKEPTLKTLVEYSSLNNNQVHSKFNNDKDLIYFIFHEVDNQIKKEIYAKRNDNSNEDIIEFFMDAVVDSVYKRRELLHFLYTKESIKGIWTQYLKKEYLRLLTPFFAGYEDNTIAIDITVNIGIDLISVWLSNNKIDSPDILRQKAMTLFNTNIKDIYKKKI
ncbi:XRE family transcriptional regulator [Apilactobacillus micheneri]|uniref:XRE family transcriptional regulator n=1 Tax=Apilactobacillus micheneri TaxID=1899430 RepID=A0A9Q8IMI0_9LACO|nr:helix-turn-helix transcriptional regulator [Apilactobacillus micheneri]TPR39897.1 XRE family transcriptional regulator [Apilactobacillus micheneri]TPR43818.1 XRE family transcriptional regulator [Apilactobacillus micheneri]TPR45371.1 XRE family transcriptional regulator [Apilactobacillus micheneri]